MGLITIFLLALLALIALHLAVFAVNVMIIGFKIGIVAFVGMMIWKCIKAATRV